MKIQSKQAPGTSREQGAMKARINKQSGVERVRQLEED